MPALRPVLTATAVLASTALLATACSSSATSPAGSSGDAGGRQTVTFMGFYGTFQDAFTKTVIKPFEKANPDIKVTYVPIQNSAEVLAKLRASSKRPVADVALMDSSVAPTANKEKLFAPIDAAKVPNVENLVDSAKSKDGYGPAVTFDSLSILYNSKNVKKAPTSWNDLWDAEYQGKLAMPIADTRGVALIVALEKILGADYQKDIDPAIDKLKTLSPAVETWQPTPDVYTAIQSGDADVAVGWNARGQYYKDSSKGVVQPVLPKEGTVTQVNTINLVNNSQHTAAAQKFIDYAIGAEAQKAFDDEAFYAPVNKDVQLAAATKERTQASEEQQKNQIPVDWSWMTSRYTAWVDRIKQEVIGG
ncbi:ABC transporter substrate-binding protein [Streptomyces paludis]|uniref:ABC transporter substrate-binding protein n=1 Tax=Streptomyces paludis TaxID=2282738 RepID=A0A345HXK1_9ACTN|nr:ABC transporter substrate-binding protein [Streptomyces paludis]AXG81425.1 ABC transporter substrate-binding protein [Streptomyces paludis]